MERFDEPAPASFYHQVAADEVRKVLHLVGDPGKLIPFVGIEHFGGPQLTPVELRCLLKVLEACGVTRYVFYHYGVATEGIWKVLTESSG